MCSLREILRDSHISDAALRVASLQPGTEEVSFILPSPFTFAKIVFLFSEFQPCLPKKRCPQCKSTFDTETKLLMHLGCTHREVSSPQTANTLLPFTNYSPAGPQVLAVQCKGTDAGDEESDKDHESSTARSRTHS